jgi:hypothetical protein
MRSLILRHVAVFVKRAKYVQEEQRSAVRMGDIVRQRRSAVQEKGKQRVMS